MLEYCQLDPQEQTSVKLNGNSNIFIQENAFKNVVWTISAILSRSQSGYHSVPVFQNANTVKPVCNDHLYNKINYQWFIQ